MPNRLAGPRPPSHHQDVSAWRNRTTGRVVEREGPREDSVADNAVRLSTVTINGNRCSQQSHNDPSDAAKRQLSLSLAVTHTHAVNRHCNLTPNPL